jgi:hypothetical protein
MLSSRSNLATTDEVFRDAQALALFANLEPSGVEYFRNNYPNFIPDEAWSGSPALAIPLAGGVPEPMSHWRAIQGAVRELWRNESKFPLESVIEFIAMIAQVAKGYKDHKENIETVTGMMAGKISMMSRFSRPEIFPCQKAVTFLGVQPWRARFCVCGNRFVAAVPASRFCSDKCFQASRRSSGRAWWSTNGTDWRNGKTKQKGTKKSSKKGKR